MNVATQSQSPQEYHIWEVQDKTGIHFSVLDSPGVLNKVLKVFFDNSIDLTHIRSKPSPFLDSERKTEFYVDFRGNISELNVQKAIAELRERCADVMVTGTPEVPYFPVHIMELDRIGKKTLGEGSGIQEVDHPQFRDKEYMKRRDEIAAIGLNYSMADPELPHLDYTDVERGVWKTCYDKLMPLMEQHACQEFLYTLGEMEKHCGFKADNIPQLEDISRYINKATGWRLKPVGGLLSQREFLNGLAFRTFHSTQYIRHHSKPFYTPEPDIVHELFGHAAMFAHKDFAEFSQQIGLASLGADEAEIMRLGAIYWFTIEFGVCLENGKRKSYGAGINSSVDEIINAMSDNPVIHPLDCKEIARNHTEFPISSVQPYYFLAESLEDAKVKISDYCNNINRPFNVCYHNATNSVEVDRKIKTRPEKDGC